ncbi:hypothetical protein [Burkholderia territorii]|nr:hypothetical protein [Burkholderia territorii]MBM2772774.1 hypothetical protein [Burkholderia territorii]HDR8862756.1 hypothetical protein [Burkholderia territorii]HDR8869991.1 hypothetical protein [Burkholderia territorii]HDR8880804.1 hypothetical protein [Burkholderia territorii]HDR8887124.1 hypothetical protein [Burkholderia territorii]
MKAFEYEIVPPERLIKFDNSPDFEGKARVTPLPSAVLGLSGSVHPCRRA